MNEIVRAYTRKADIQEVDFLRGPLRGIEEHAIEELRAALDEATCQ